MPQPRIAIAPFLVSCPRVITLGVRAAVSDYSAEEKGLLASAGRIFFPTPRFAKIFEAAGKDTFPNAFTYGLRKSRQAQEALFRVGGWPHPRARVYFGRQKASIVPDFRFPFLAMGPNVSDRPRLIENTPQLADATGEFNPLIIREKLEYDERFLLVFVNFECIATLQEVPGATAPPVAFSRPTATDLPPSAAGFRHTLSNLLRSFRINDIAVEIGLSATADAQVLSLVRPPLWWRTPGGTANRHDLIAGLIREGRL
ncbi:MAG: hypothetical protein WAW37_15675 [Syntrophobacteraceae bacterium]